MHPTYAYCAARVLDHWIRSEVHHHNALQDPDPKSIRAALAYFKVSRGFAGIEKTKTGRQVAELLVEHDRYVTPNSAVTRVSELASSFEQRLKYDHLLSAASKLLWLRRLSPIIIFDSRAVRALKKLTPGTDLSTYAAYCDAWRTQFSSRKAQIQHAAGQLHQFSAFTAAAHLGPSFIRELIGQPWFCERVFDQYLWLTGAPRRKHTQGVDDAA